MEYINVSTTQNIDLEYRMAGIGDRILAYGFDLLVVSSWGILWAIVLYQLGGYHHGKSFLSCLLCFTAYSPNCF